MDVANKEMERGVIWPKLQSLPVIALVRATGLSYGYCNQIKLGHKTPHPSWGGVLRELV